MHEGHFIDARAKRRDDFIERLGAIAVLFPAPGGAKRGAKAILKEFDVLARIPFLAVALVQERLVVKRVEVTGSAGHEELHDPFGLRRVV